MLTVWICWQPPANSESRLDVVCVYLLMFYGSDSQHFLAITQLSRMIFLIPPTGVDKRTFPRKLCKTRLLLVQSGTILDMKQHLIILMEFSILFRQIYIYYFTHWKFHYPPERITTPITTIVSMDPSKSRSIPPGRGTLAPRLRNTVLWCPIRPPKIELSNLHTTFSILHTIFSI